MTIKREDIRAAIVKLAKTYPNTFVADGWDPHRPLKIGISHELVALDVLPTQVLKAVLGAYTARRMYQAALVAGAGRIGLDGQPAGAVTESEAESAAERLKPLDEHRAEVAAQANQAFKALKGAMVEVETAPTAPAEAPRRLSLADLKTAARVRRTA